MKTGLVVRLTVLAWFVLSISSFAQTSIPLTHPNIHLNGVWFPEIHDSLVVLNRHQQQWIEHPESGVSTTSAPFARTQTGIQIQLKTASPTLFFEFEEREDAGKMGLFEAFRIMVDGKVYETYQSLSFEILKPSWAKDTAAYTLILPSLHGVHWRSLRLSEGYDLEPIEEIPKPVFVSIGNSISHGTGQQSASFRTWPYLLSEFMDWSLVNLSIAGSRTGWPITEHLRNQKVDVVTISLGFNDWMWDTSSLNQKEKAYKRLLDSLRSIQPKAKLYCITPIKTTETMSALGAPFSLSELRKAQVRVVEEKQKVDTLLFLIHGDSLSSKDWLFDGIHLSRAGAEQWAQALKNHLSEWATSINESILPSSVAILEQNIPNPFNPITTIPFSLSQPSNVSLTIYDLQGRKVEKLVDAFLGSGRHSVQFDGSSLASGVYLVRLEGNTFNQTKRITLVK